MRTFNRFTGTYNPTFAYRDGASDGAGGGSAAAAAPAAPAPAPAAAPATPAAAQSDPALLAEIANLKKERDTLAAKAAAAEDEKAKEQGRYKDLYEKKERELTEAQSAHTALIERTAFRSAITAELAGAVPPRLAKALSKLISLDGLKLSTDGTVAGVAEAIAAHMKAEPELYAAVKAGGGGSGTDDAEDAEPDEADAGEDGDADAGDGEEAAAASAAAKKVGKKKKPTSRTRADTFLNNLFPASPGAAASAPNKSAPTFSKSDFKKLSPQERKQWLSKFMSGLRTGAASGQNNALARRLKSQTQRRSA